MKTGRAKEIIDQFASKKILVVGDVVLDQYIFGKVERINPEAPVPILHAHEERFETGGAGNVAKNAAMLGAAANLIAVTGKDKITAQLQELALHEGYKATLLQDDTRPTTRKIRYIAQSQQMLRVDYEEMHELNHSLEEQVFDSIKEQSSNIDGIIVSDYAKGVITQRIAQQLLATAHEQNIPIAVDVKPSRAAWFKGASFISPNLKEARQFIGLDPFEHNDKSYADLAKELRRIMETDVYITLSAEGIYVNAHETIEHIPQPHVPQIADTSGGGDAAITTILLSLLSGATPVEAAQLANAAGAVVVSKLGAVGVTPAELLNVLSSLPIKE